MVKLLFYPVFLFMVFVLSLIYIPKQDYKEYFIYGVLMGGLGDVISVGIFQNLLHVIWFKNMGIFNALGQNLLSPPSWVFVIMLFLRFLPRRRYFLVFYVLTVAMSSVGYGILVRNAGLFDYRSWFYPVVSFFVFLAWWCTATWLFLKTSTLAAEDN
ncbi:MAG: hypothetical protein ACOWWO_16865 [Peptococcaceae bacterium]